MEQEKYINTPLKYAHLDAAVCALFLGVLPPENFYNVIKNYIFLCVTGECNAKFTDNQEKIFFESLLKLHNKNVKKLEKMRKGGQKGAQNKKEKKQAEIAEIAEMQDALNF